jgi:hypothetical protein
MGASFLRAKTLNTLLDFTNTWNMGGAEACSTPVAMAGRWHREFFPQFYSSVCLHNDQTLKIVVLPL